MLVLIFMYLQINRINEFRGTLSASKGFFILVLIFMYLQIYIAAEWFFTLVLIFSRICKFLGTLNAAKKCFILLLIFMYLHISRISQFRGRMTAAE